MQDNNIEIYADGAELMLGSSVSKLNFYSIKDVSQQGEQKEFDKELKVQVAISTTSLLSLCSEVLFHAKADEEKIIDMIESDKQEVLKILQKLNLPKLDAER